MQQEKPTSSESSSVEQSLADRGNNRSRRPNSDAFKSFIGTGWGPRPEAAGRAEVADYLPARHAQLGQQFLGKRLVIPAGGLKVRANDTDYRFRAHSAFAHLSGLGGELEPDSVLVLEPLTDAAGKPLAGTSSATHQAVLFFQPRAPRSSEQFYADSRYGEFWVGARPSLEEMEQMTGLRCAPIDTLRDALSKDLGLTQLLVIRGVDQQVEDMVEELRQQAGLDYADDALPEDNRLSEAASTMRLCKDAFEISQLRHAVEVTKQGFEDVIAALPRAVKHWRGERVIEGAFAARAREEGNGLGYDTIAASGNHANTLHWIDNTGPVKEGDLVLIDAGVEVDSLYTADITRTLPVNGKFTPTQRKVYEAVLEACEAALARANKPGCHFREVHEAAMEVLAQRLYEWGCLPEGVTPQQTLAPEGQWHRRWMPHGTSHHLGLDVHDCAQAAREMYLDAKLQPGMCFTIEPGLYFREDDLLIPPDLRGMGVRIEDDVIVNADGTVTRISEDIPRTVEAVEEWMAQVQSRS